MTLPMQSPTSKWDDLCSQAIQAQIAGRLADAEEIYRTILSGEPRHARANHCLGMLEVQYKRPGKGLVYLLTALELEPQNADYWLGYLEAMLLDGQIEAATQTLALATERGLAGPATEDFAKRLQARAQAGEPTLATATPRTRAERRRDERRAVVQERALLTLVEQGRFTQARAAARTSTEQFPDRGLGWKILGAMLWADGRKDEALDAMRTAARLLTDDAELLSNLGATLATLDRFAEAENALRQALRIDPSFAAAHAHLSNVYQLQGRYQEAESSLREAISLRPSQTIGVDLRYSSLLFMLSHNPTVNAAALFAEHCRIGDLLEAHLRTAWPRHANDSDPRRLLQIGFVSGDLCNHAVAHFIEPVLAELAQYRSLRLHAYYNNSVDDEVARRLRTRFADWQAIAGLSDSELAKRILMDRIDILIDLSGHTSLNRLAAFARKPAPIQASWIGYPGTTGLCAMDYYLADRHFLPPGRFEPQFREKLVFLPANVPFRPFERAPEVAPLPALVNSTLTFGSFNRLGKITAATVDAWAALLRALPSSRLIVGGIPIEGAQIPLWDSLRARGIEEARLTFHARCDMETYLAHHHGVDICLDTYPYSGGTTTIHAVWMGVPTLTIAGSTPASRQGAAILGQLGLDEFVAMDAADFVAKGCYWAGNLGALAEVRAGLRDRWLRSPGRHPEVIAAGLERSLRHMWERWCAGREPESFHASSLANQENTGA